VSEQELAENLRAMVSQVRAAGAEPVVLWFPQPGAAPSAAEVAQVEAALEGLPVLTPSLARELFFDQDPIHLNPAGHQALATWIDGAISH
jgi:lysophospholipase L1-like esterase